MPFHPLAREPYLAVTENQTCHARWWTSDRGRPTIVIIHGWGGGNHWVTFRTFLVPYWLRHGWDVVAFQLPFHGNRAPGTGMGKSGALFPSPNPLRTNEGFAHAIYDLRALAMFLRPRGTSAVGAMGMSLGGYTTALWASIAGTGDAGGADFAVAMIPAVSMSKLMWRHGETSPVRARATKAGITEDLLTDAFEVHAPTTRPPRVPKDRRFIIAGRGDRITPPGAGRGARRSLGGADPVVRGRPPRADRPQRRAAHGTPVARRARVRRTRASGHGSRLAEAIAAGPLLLDGAMGSLLYERGVLHTRSSTS